MSLNSVKYFYFIELMSTYIKVNFDNSSVCIEYNFNIISTSIYIL